MEKTNQISLYIVEDYLLSRTTYKHYLSNVEWINILGDFETAEECLHRMEFKPADVIIMDLGLPKMNGIEATKLINEKYPNTKVLILTSHEQDEEVFACLASGANGYALKDIDLNELGNVIRLIDSGAVWIDPKIAKIALSAFPQPNSTNFDNLYEKDAPDVHLTEREMEVLKLVIQGKSNTEIAKEIFISPHTAKSHVCKILSKLAVTDRVQAAVKAVQYNLFK